MDKVQRYLDKVCRGIAGPRALRQHIRQELAEHLRDAAAVHQAAGMGEEEALARALEDFGGPEQVRAELEATHGHRLLTMVVDKALQWKETTMKVRWVWTTWAHVTLFLLIAVELAFIGGCVIFIVPKFLELAREGWIDATAPGGSGAINQWARSVVERVVSVCRNGVWWALVVAAIWALFEWRVRSENKTLMRLSALGTGAVGLAVAAFFTAAALILPPIAMTGAGNRYAANRVAAAHIVQLDDSMKLLDAAIAAKDWNTTERQIGAVASHLRALWYTGIGQPLWEGLDPEKGTSMDVQFHTLLAALQEARNAIGARFSGIRDETRFASAMQEFREAYGRWRPAAIQTAPK